ncbi:MAG: hypothetical protein C4308_05755 [Chitinophagaceae bacterium]
MDSSHDFFYSENFMLWQKTRNKRCRQTINQRLNVTCDCEKRSFIYSGFANLAACIFSGQNY